MPGYIPPGGVQQAGIGAAFVAAARFVARSLFGIGAAIRGARFVGAFASAAKLLEHFQSYAAKLGFGTVDEYLAGAQKLVAAGLSNTLGVQTFVRANGDILFYNANTNQFAAIASNGVIKTFFAPITASSIGSIRSGESAEEGSQDLVRSSAEDLGSVSDRTRSDAALPDPRGDGASNKATDAKSNRPYPLNCLSCQLP